jgi:hypothetical protein
MHNGNRQWVIGNGQFEGQSMIVEALIGVCFFAGIAIVLCIPWLGHADAGTPDSHAADHH